MTGAALAADRGEGALWAAVLAGDHDAFAAVAGRYQRELEVHAYRMLGSVEDAEDVVQETFLRAWRRRETFRGQASLRAWLYGIATNASLRHPARAPGSRRLMPHSGKAGPTDPAALPEPSKDISRLTEREVTWLEPYPDQLLDEVVSGEDSPDQEDCRAGDWSKWPFWSRSSNCRRGSGPC